MERLEDLDGEEQEEKCCTGKFLHNLCALFHKSATWAICSMLRMNFYLLFTTPSPSNCEDDGWGLGRAVLVCEALWTAQTVECVGEGDGCCHAES